MAIKYYQDEVPPQDGRLYEITDVEGGKNIRDITNYPTQGTPFGAADVNAGCVLECNYEKSGTVHILTTPNITSENIKFYAASAYNQGDTFKFGADINHLTDMTALTLTGRSLPGGMFDANTVVTCFKKDNVLYFNAGSGDHTQSANTITDGTLGGKVLANTTAIATLGNKQVRNIYAGTTDMTPGTTSLSTGDIYFMYE